MSHLSPAVNLVWALLSIMLGSFLVFHLWSFDRFKCLKWNHGPHSGAFKRIMTYSYLLSVPLIMIYALGFTIIKYNYGFSSIPLVGILPTPYELWSQQARNAIFPLYFSVSLAWGLEMVTHLEELCFWLFLVHSTSAQQDWFRSVYFKIWVVGSCTAVLTMPLITIFTRENVYKCEAYTFLAGGLASLSLTIWFLPVLYAFPSFLANLRKHNVETSTLLRLTKFHELNHIRIVFRFLFTVPLVILGIDGVRPHQHINENMLATDLLAIVAGIGCVVSSGLTLIIFFPRSREGELARNEQQWSRKRQGLQENGWLEIPGTSGVRSYISITQAKSNLDLEQYVPTRKGTSSSETGLPAYEVVVTRGREQEASRPPTNLRTAMEEVRGVGSLSLQPNRRNENGDVELGGVLTRSQVELARARTTRDGYVSELVHQWRSPLDVGRPPPSSWQRFF